MQQAAGGMPAGPQGPVTVYTTLAKEPDAVVLVRKLVEQRLVACGNILPARSVYRWKGEVREEPEVAIFLKTDATRLSDLLGVLPGLHPYEVPCIEVLPVAAAHQDFSAWVARETLPEPDRPKE